MLAIKFKNSDKFELEWHIGEPMPIDTNFIEEIAMIQADGHELTHISNQYSTINGHTIPVYRGYRVMRWCGSIAQTIVANLCS